MKKIILSIFALPLIALCCSMSINAQSSETDLDQVELMKQFIGTWKAEIQEDTTQIWEAIPLEKGYEVNVSWQAKGETYATGKGIMGFTWEYRTVNWYHVWPSGYISRDMGKFVSDKKMTLERFTADHKGITASMELNFITPDKFKVIYTSRVWKEDSWVDDKVIASNYTRVKK